MKIKKSDLKQLIQEEVSVMVEEFGDDSPFRMRDMVPPKVRGKFKDTFTKIPNPELEKYGAERRAYSQEKDAWKAAGGQLSIFDKEAIAKFLEDARLNISLEKYMDNVKYAVKGDRLGRQINSLVDALALANMTGSRRGHLKDPRGRKGPGGAAPEFTRESIERIIKEELSDILDESASEADRLRAARKMEVDKLTAADPNWSRWEELDDVENYIDPVGGYAQRGGAAALKAVQGLGLETYEEFDKEYAAQYEKVKKTLKNIALISKEYSKQIAAAPKPKRKPSPNYPRGKEAWDAVVYGGPDGGLGYGQDY